MAQPVYSVNLFAGDLSSSFPEIYTVPAGFTAVIRDMRLRNTHTSTQISNVQVSVSGSSTFVIWQEEAFPAAQLDEWTGRVVVPAGGGIWGYSDHSDVSAVISGYLLSTT